MQFQVFTDQPTWFWLLCIIGGAGYAFALYWREKKIISAIQRPALRYTLAVCRGILATILLLLLLNPYIKSSVNETEKPVVVLLHDNSSSIAAGIKDTTAERNNWLALQNALSDNFDVRAYTFGETISDQNGAITLNAPATNMSEALQSINNLYENVHVAGVIMASDGIYNSGSNPVYIPNALNAPIYTVALGDTTQKKDIRILRTLHNNIVYLKDRFTVQSEYEAIFCNGASTQATISLINGDARKSLGAQTISVKDAQENGSVTWELSADAPGIQHYRISIQSINGEHTTANNVQDIYIEVLDARQKILLLAAAPHPDLQALRMSMEANGNYSVDVQLAPEFKGVASDYDLIVLHQLPTVSQPAVQVLDMIRSKHIPVWFITGNQTATNIFNKAQSLVTINSNGQSANEVTALVESNFNLFTIEDPTRITLPRWPALAAPYGQYNLSPAAQVAAWQKIGTVATKTPLLIYSLPGADKTAVWCGENVWKWRLYDYVLNNTQENFDELVGKTIQYLAVKNDKKQFRVSQARQVYNETESIVLDAELYNDSYELVNEPDASIVIKDEKGNDFSFQFSKTGKSYTLAAGYFPAGAYSFTATTTLNGKTYTDNGAFSILPVRLETINTTANHQLMHQLAVQTGGVMVNENNMQSLVDQINNSAAAKPVMREITKTHSVINLKWIFFLLLLLLSVEWFVRKFMGGY